MKNEKLNMKKTTNKLWISLFLAMTVGLSLANGEMLHSEVGVTFDTDTKLLWEDNLEAKTVRKNWQDAMGYCENLKLSGFDDWKLPNRNTLNALYPKKDGLQNVTEDSYWSSSKSVSGSSNTWNVPFGNGYDLWDIKPFSFLVRCVRDSNFETLTFSSFVESLKTSNSAQESIILSSSSKSKSELFLVKKDNKSYFGTKDELLKQFSIVSQYSKKPFEDIQKLTQQKLNEYLTLPVVPAPKVVKDEFESKAEFEQRVQTAQEEYRQEVEQRNNELENRKANIEAKKKEYLFENFSLVMGEPKLENPIFDAETNTMFVDVVMSNAEWKKNIGIKMEDRNLAKNFKKSIDNVTSKVSFGYENDGFILQNFEVEFEKNNLVATLSEKDFKPEKIVVALQGVSHIQNPNLIVPNIIYGESNQAKGLKYNNDLTPLIKNLATSKVDTKKWLFVIAVENYDEADAVTYAKNSAEDFVKVAQKRLGISERNTYSLIDDKATSGSIKDRLDMMLKNVKDGDSVYFYYSGHGIPNPNDGEAYILPKDKIVDYVTREKEFMVRNIYKQLSDSKASKVIAFMDSCFSGNTDGISNIKGVAATRVKTKKVEFDKDKMVVLTAGTANQFSNMYKEKGHRLFSYFLTKAMIERPNLDVDSIYKSISVDVKDESFKMGDLKVQEPQIEGNVKIGL